IEWFMLEACEYYRHFLNYESEYAIITNIELDHVDYYKNIDDLIDAYQSYANKAKKMIIACGDDPYTHSLEVNDPIFFYGIGEDNDIIAKEIEYKDSGMEFEVYVEGNYYGFFSLPFYGKHMLLNSLAVISICYYERIEAKVVSKFLKTFKGAKRRFAEHKIGNVVTVDDYAHHPTEVKATIKAAKQKYPDKEIIAVFEPHTFSRTQHFYEDLSEALNLADKAYILDIYNAREKQEDYPSVTSDLIIDRLNNGSHIRMDEVDKLLAYDNAVILFMSPKEIYELKHDLETKLMEKEVI
ncbi:MAG: cyanophycin synthetase, partial [Bacilli bacterium]|nr:cyanophycin synthetase [Bacilli bacterium]